MSTSLARARGGGAVLEVRARGAAGRCWSCSAWPGCCGRRPGSRGGVLAAGCPPRDWPAGRLRARLVAAAPLALGAQRPGDHRRPVLLADTHARPADELGRPKGIVNVPEDRCRAGSGRSCAAGSLAAASGFFLACVSRGAGLALPAALAVLGGLAFCAIGIAGLSLLGRYLFLPAAMLAIFFAVACSAGSSCPGRAGGARWWPVAARVADRLRRVDRPAHRSTGSTRCATASQRAAAIAGRPAQRSPGPRGRPCWSAAVPVYVPNHRPVPILAWYLERPSAAGLRLRAARAADRGGRACARHDAVSRASSCSTRHDRSRSCLRAPAGSVACREPFLAGCTSAAGCCGRQLSKSGPCTPSRNRVPGRARAFWLRPGFPAAHGR